MAEEGICARESGGRDGRLVLYRGTDLTHVNVRDRWGTTRVNAVELELSL